MNTYHTVRNPWATILTAALALSALPGAPAHAARTVRATVDAKGNLRFSRATLKALGVSTRDGLVAVELPLSLRPVKKPAAARKPVVPIKPGTPHVHGPDCDHLTYEGPPRLFVSLRPDGSLEIRKQKVPPYKVLIPGLPGTVFLASSEKGKLVLAKPR